MKINGCRAFYRANGEVRECTCIRQQNNTKSFAQYKTRRNYWVGEGTNQALRCALMNPLSESTLSDKDPLPNGLVRRKVPRVDPKRNAWIGVDMGYRLPFIERRKKRLKRNTLKKASSLASLASF